MQSETRTCLECGHVVKGRTDKKFCNDYCRNVFNNRLNSDHNNYVRNINNALRKNRRILEQLLKPRSKTRKCDRQNLVQLGFDFRYKTHQIQNAKGQCFHCCYEYAYLALDPEKLLIVQNAAVGYSAH